MNKGELDSLLERSDSLLQLTIGVLIAVWGIVALLSWMASADLRIPLLLLGLCVIALGIALTKNGIAVTIAILIVGYLVVPQDYLIRIAHMVTNPETAVAEYTIGYRGEPSESDVLGLDNAMNRVAKALEEQSDDAQTNEQAVRDLSDILSKESTALFVRLVRNEDAIFPLQQVVQGDAKQLDEEYGHHDFFREDMRLLQSLQLITFRGDHYGDAEATDFGRQVAAFHEEEMTAFDVPSDPVDLFREERPPADEMILLTVGRTYRSVMSSRRASWHRFYVYSDADYVITVSSDDGDPFVGLYGSDGGLLVEDDDGGEGLSSEISRFLQSGWYYVGVVGRRVHDAEYRVDVTRITRNGSQETR